MFAFVQRLSSRVTREAALLRRNVRSRRGRFLPECQRIVVLENALPDRKFCALRDLVLQHRDLLRRRDSFIRHGGALGGHELRTSPCRELVTHLEGPEFLERVRAGTGIPELVYVPASDTNRLSLLYYGASGDGIDWHVDGTIYLGDRWVGVLTLEESSHDATSKLEIEGSDGVESIPAEQAANTLVLFQGDQHRHRVRPMASGEERIVVSLLLTTNPEQTRNPLLWGYQAVINYFFYGNPKL